MHIPLNNLYHWIESLLPEPAIVYRFDPPGAKSITNLTHLVLYSDLDQHLLPEIICHDQEPLFFSMYENFNSEIVNKLIGIRDTSEATICANNLRAALNQVSIYDNVILIHSEKNSSELETYAQNGYIPVHYWAHAVIARDWFRFAKWDTRIKENINFDKLFLIYNRDWTGTREYRLKFAQMLVDNQLLPWCKTSIQKTINCSNYQFKNSKLSPNEFDFINQFNENNIPASASADYNVTDVNDTAISVVLETMFDDTRIHLTEKTLRPIACGHPFILAAGPNSLEYIKSYGFKTFSPWIDESYDSETDSLLRLEKIIKSMKKIQSLPATDQEDVLKEIYKIAEFNKNWFFSDEFATVIKNELKANLDRAFSQVKKTRGKYYLRRYYRYRSSYVERRRAKLLKLRQLRQTK